MGEAAIEAQLRQQLDGEDIDEFIASAEKAAAKKPDIRRQYIFDLYRFFHSYPYKQQFTNPFALLKEHPITPYSNEWLTMLLGAETDEMAHYADFLMRKEFYATALQLLEHLDKNEFEEKYASIWQKMGFCHQKLSHTADAIKAYDIANTLKPDSKWTLSHLVSLHFAEGAKPSTASSSHMEEATRLYQELLQIEPENQRYLLHLSQALMHGERYEEALQSLYKALYLDETSMPLKLLLGWCLLLCGQKEKAAKYVLEVQAEDALNEEAQMLFALILLMDGKVREAYHQLTPLLSTTENQQKIADKLMTLAHLNLLDSTSEILFSDALTLNID